MLPATRSARNALFLELKPPCVALSQLALRDDGNGIDSTRDLVQSTTQLLEILEQKCQRTDGVFDQKLADYVFFPLSQILRRKKQHTDRLSELTIRCLAILLEYGWRTVELDLGKQLLILLAFIAGGVPGKVSPTPPEETLIATYRSLTFLFQDLSHTPGGPASLVDSATIPALGHCITVILEGVTEGPSVEAQLQALEALGAVWRCIKDAETLGSFLPGTISALTKCLMPTTGSRRAKKTIVRALAILQNVLVSVLGDIRTRNIKNKDEPSSEVTSAGSEGTGLTSSWLRATTGQIKLALSNVIRLRKHESEEVQSSLCELCITLLDECHETLAESAPMLVETSMTLDGVVEAEGSLFSERKTSLLDLAAIYPDIREHVKNTVYNWVTSLPRIMQANDESAKCIALDQLSKSHNLFSSLNLESSILQDSLASSLRDSLIVTLESSTVSKYVEEAAFNLNSQAAMTLVVDNALITQFRPVLLAEEIHKQILGRFTALLENIGTRESRIKLAKDMLDYARGASGHSLLSAYWLSTHLLQSLSSNDQDLDEFLDTSLTISDEQDSLNKELFSYSLSVLADAQDSIDWRVQTIALQVMAQTAKQRKQEFRTDLVDTIYPVIQLLGSPNPRLREHAITCLNIISKSCGYNNASDLIVSNADYMVNAISLRLNTFDISPSAPQVLVMMIRLTGPSLLLYLDDVVGSIFAALDNFHGYNLLVESLFSVLGEIVSVGSNSNQLRVDNAPTASHRKTRPPVPSIDQLLALLKPHSQPSQSTNILEHEDFPRQPWKTAKTLLDESTIDPPADTPADEEDSVELAPIPPTKTYTMLQSITRLSQHYLTSSSPHLRSKLLSLITTSSLALSPSEPDFLPLINDIWPVVIQRLYDTEPYVQIAAAETVGALCETAGDFLSSRIDTEWSSLFRLAKTVKANAEKEKKGKGARGIFSQAAKVWEAVLGLLVKIAGNIRVEEGMFDDILDVVGLEILVERGEFRAILEEVNADAVWLALQLVGRNERLVTPVVEGYLFVELGGGVVV